MTEYHKEYHKYHKGGLGDQQYFEWHKISDESMFGGPIPETDQNQYNKVSEDLKTMREQDNLVLS